MNSEEKVPSNRAEGVPNVEKATSDASFEQLENGTPDNLVCEHREYLLQRHGTVDLIPLPSIDPNDPLNWPSWKVSFLFLISI